MMAHVDGEFLHGREAIEFFSLVEEILEDIGPGFDFSRCYIYDTLGDAFLVARYCREKIERTEGFIRMHDNDAMKYEEARAEFDDYDYRLLRDRALERRDQDLLVLQATQEALEMAIEIGIP